MTEKPRLAARTLAAVVSAALLLTCPGSEAYAVAVRVRTGAAGSSVHASANGGVFKISAGFEASRTLAPSAFNGSLKLAPSLKTLPQASVLASGRRLDQVPGEELSDPDALAEQKAKLAQQLGLKEQDAARLLENNTIDASLPRTGRFKGAAKKIGAGLKSLRQIFSFRGEGEDLSGPRFRFRDGLKGKDAKAGLTKASEDSAKDEKTGGEDKTGDVNLPPVAPPKAGGGSNRGSGGKGWFGLGKAAALLIVSLIIMQVGVESWAAALGPLVQQIYGDFTLVATVGIWASIAGIAGRLLAPLVIDRFGEKKSYLGANILRFASVTVLCALLATGHMTLPLMIFFYSLNGLVGGTATTALDKLAKTLMNGEQAKLEKFWTTENTTLEIIGFSAPILTGWVVVSFGFMPALAAYPIAFAIAIAIAALALRRNLKAFDQAAAKLQDKRKPLASLWAPAAQAVWPVFAPVARWAIRNAAWLSPVAAALAVALGLAGAWAISAPTVLAFGIGAAATFTSVSALAGAALVLAAGVTLAAKLRGVTRRASTQKEAWLQRLEAMTPPPGLLARMIAGVKSVWKDEPARKSPKAWLKAVVVEPFAGTVVGRFLAKLRRGAKHVWSRPEKRLEPSAWGKFALAYPFNGTMVGGFFQKIAHGARVTWKNPTLRYSFLAYTAYMIINPLMYAILAPGYGNLLAGPGNEELMTAISGWLTGFYSLGGLLVGLWMIREQKQIKKGREKGAAIEPEAAPQRSFAARAARFAQGYAWLGAALLPTVVKGLGIPALVAFAAGLGYLVSAAYSPWVGLFIFVSLATAAVKGVLAAAAWLDRTLTPRAKAYFAQHFQEQAAKPKAPKRALKERAAAARAALAGGLAAARRALLGALWSVTPKSWFKARRRAFLRSIARVGLVKYSEEEQAELLRRSMLRWMRWGTVGLLAIATMALPLPLIGSSLSVPALALIGFGVAQVAATIKLTSFFQAKTPSDKNDEAAVLGFFRYASLAASTIGLLSLKYLFNATTGYTPFVVIALALIPLAGYYVYLTGKLRRVTDPKNPDASDPPAVAKIAGFIAGAFLAGMVGLTAMSGSWLMTLVAALVLGFSARARWKGEKALYAAGWRQYLKGSRLAPFALGALAVTLLGLF